MTSKVPVCDYREPKATSPCAQPVAVLARQWKHRGHDEYDTRNVCEMHLLWAALDHFTDTDDLDRSAVRVEKARPDFDPVDLEDDVRHSLTTFWDDVDEDENSDAAAPTLRVVH